MNEADFILGIEWLAKKIKHHKVYAIPKNGWIVALLAGVNMMDLCFKPEEASCIVDDLIDSGKTMQKYAKLGKPMYCLYRKPHSPNIEGLEVYGTVERWITFPWEEGEKKEIQDHVTRIIEAIGENPAREGLEKTPDRVARAYKTLFSGYTDTCEMTVFENESEIDQIIGLSDIEFYSTCEHHMLPFFGKAHIYYIPDQKICGISKLARILDVFSKRLQNQERIAKQTADALESLLKPKALAVIIEAEHFCMKARGVSKQNAVMRTSDLRGAFRDNAMARQELFNLIKK